MKEEEDKGVERKIHKKMLIKGYIHVSTVEFDIKDHFYRKVDQKTSTCSHNLKKVDLPDLNLNLELPLCR